MKYKLVLLKLFTKRGSVWVYRKEFYIDLHRQAGPPFMTTLTHPHSHAFAQPIWCLCVVFQVADLDGPNWRFQLKFGNEKGEL